MIKHIFLFLLTASVVFVTNIETALFVILLYALGSIIVRQFNHLDNRKYSINIYQTVYLIGLAYIVLCFVYMQYHNYDYLLAFDTINSFLPNTERYLAAGSLHNIFSEVWSNFDFFDRNPLGYYTFTSFFGYFAQALNANLYFSLQSSTLFVSGLISVLFYRLLVVNKLSPQISNKYAIITSVFSVFFFYSTLILRDMHIALFYICGVYITYLKFSGRNIIILFVLAFMTSIFRIESGLFFLSFIPVYILLSFRSKRSITYTIIGSTIVLVALGSFAIQNYSYMVQVFEANREIYVDRVLEGSGLIAFFQSLPPIISDILSIIYNGVQPLPFWGKLTPAIDPTRPEAYNIMTFPLSFAAFFNWIVIFFIMFYLLVSNLRRKVNQIISLPLKYNITLGLLFLFIQSSVIAQRRLIGYYLVFYALFFMIYSNTNHREKRQIVTVAALSFVFVQLIAYQYLTR